MEQQTRAYDCMVCRCNTNGSNFTHFERQQLGQGSKKERLGRDAMKNFNACSLCLERARDPRVCGEGHVFCQECIISSLLSQKSSIKRQTALLAQLRESEATALAAARQSARERVLREFEAAQSGLGKGGVKGKVVSGGLREGSESGASTPTVGGKRKFELEEGEIERLLREGEEEALGRINKELEESRKAKLPNFWLPSLTPNAEPTPLEEVKLQTLCTVEGKGHPLSLKSLTTIKFTEDETDSAPVGERHCICPVCRKGLTNNVKAFVMKACGDVVCTTCVTTLCIPDSSCAACNTPFPAPKKAKEAKEGQPAKKAKKEETSSGVIELKREGTGFAAGGMVEVKKYDLAFQG
ncbi:zinc finger protein, nitric oxide synthase-interacting protein [Pseudohyphozyma bogoriensis]|nr:zinc finger protein, nitric oxide synthase-interacting protein [Pseudohyphozyma bogoriensis]